MLNLIIAEDHLVVRNGIKLLLEKDPDIKVTGVAGSGSEVLELIDRNEKTDVLITDIQMPGMDGIALISKVRSQWPDIKIVVLSMYDDMTHVAAAFDCGASGYLRKECTAEELIFAVKSIYAGGRYVSMAICDNLIGKYGNAEADKLASMDTDVEFSSREMEVLQLISEGLTNNEMSERLFLSRRTVEGHRQSLLEKTNCRNTAVLIKHAVQLGLVT
jgi:two-component system response regulator NreC